MTAPALLAGDFFALARSLGISAVEIRNDLAGNAIIDGTPAERVKALAEKHGLTIISINALQRFNEWNDERGAKRRNLSTYARDCGAKALVLVPVNDGSGRAGWRAAGQSAQRAGRAEADAGETPALSASSSRLASRSARCARRTRRRRHSARSAAKATFKLVHDTFHHHLAGEENSIPI